MNYISPQELKPLLTDGDEIAFLDVREHGQYGEGHPFFCVPLPYSRLESRTLELLPCKSVRLFLIDDGDGVSERAAQRLIDLHYQDVTILDGGAPAWATAGYTLYKGVHVPSKTYGELLEHAAKTPRITASELAQLRKDDPSVVVLDGRTPNEFHKMSLPGAVCCPNAELGYRLRNLVPDESTPIVINCAGRTRSILGVEGLRLLHAKNPLYALENGTQGWRLAGFDLEQDVPPQQLPEPTAAELDVLKDLATTLIENYTLQRISPAELSAWQKDDTRTTYVLDVRTADEYARAHWSGARHAPGGQLVQATDQFVAVRNARIVLSDDIGLRAATTAVRLRQMGHDVYLLNADASKGECDSNQLNSDNDSSSEIAQKFTKIAKDFDVILDASSGMQFRDAHIDGAHWVTRARIDRLTMERDSKLLVTGRDDATIKGIEAELLSFGYEDIQICIGSPGIWADAGFNIVASPDSPSDDDCIDYLFFVHDRHDGNLDAARAYLKWEVGLVDQLDAQERSVLSPQPPQSLGGA